MNDINWKEVLKETALALLAIAMFAPAMLIAYGMLATLQENEKMKTLLLITTLALSANAFGYCNWDDHECNAREAEQARQQRQIDQQQIDMDQMRREQERERAERERESNERWQINENCKYRNSKLCDD